MTTRQIIPLLSNRPPPRQACRKAGRYKGYKHYKEYKEYKEYKNSKGKPGNIKGTQTQRATENGALPASRPGKRTPRPTARTTGRETRRASYARRDGNETANEKRLHGTNTGTENGTPDTRRHGERKDGRHGRRGEVWHRFHFPDEKWKQSPCHDGTWRHSMKTR